MAKSRVPNTKQNKLAGTSSKARNSSFLNSNLMGGGLALGVGALSVAGLSSTLSSLGLPSLPDFLSNPLYLGAAAVGLFLLLK